MDGAFYFLDKEFWKYPVLVIIFTATLFVIVLLRYLLSASLYHLAIFRLLRRKPISGNDTERKIQWNREIAWSASSSVVFAVLVALCYRAFHAGLTKIYTSVEDYPVWYFVLSIVLILFLYETYYYWLHRWMHKPKVFRIVHKVHHESIHTSVFTSFSFHPIEAFLQFLFLPIVMFTIPVHYAALGIVLLLMTISAVINHAGTEIFPARFASHPLGKWLIGATHHDIHHKEFRNNFGLYFTFWDRLMKTESADYMEAFRRNTKEANREKGPNLSQ